MTKKAKYQGYIARDQMGQLNLFLHSYPHKEESEVGQGDWTNDEWDGVTIRPTDFETVKWEDKVPTPVVITIEINKKIKEL